MLSPLFFQRFLVPLLPVLQTDLRQCFVTTVVPSGLIGRLVVLNLFNTSLTSNSVATSTLRNQSQSVVPVSTLGTCHTGLMSRIGTGVFQGPFPSSTPYRVRVIPGDSRIDVPWGVGGTCTIDSPLRGTPRPSLSRSLSYLGSSKKQDSSRSPVVSICG